MVQDNLWHHDGLKYRLLAWVIMPNHVHLLVHIWEVPMGKILHGWKSYTSKQAGKILRDASGFGVGAARPQTLTPPAGDKLSPPRVFWEDDYFDRYLRDADHYRRVVRYIENNPVKAGLAKTAADWPWSSARYRGEPGEIVPVLTHPIALRVPPAPP